MGMSKHMKWCNCFSFISFSLARMDGFGWIPRSADWSFERWRMYRNFFFSSFLYLLIGIFLSSLPLYLGKREWSESD